jgi:hypothetical protein
MLDYNSKIYDMKKNQKKASKAKPKEESGMTREQFRINELVYWIVNHNKLGLRHRLEEYDAVICTEEKDTAQLWDINKIMLAGAKVGVPLSLDNQQITIYRSLTPQILRKNEILEPSELQNYSYYQHQILTSLLYAVDEYFLPFLQRLQEFKIDKIPVTDKSSQTALALLEYAIDTIRQTGIEKREPVIPDLYTYHKDTSLMSFNDKFMYKALNQRDGKKYTYMFSRTTSENFATVLLELLTKKLHDQKLIASFDSSPEKNADQNKLPLETKERLKWMSEYFHLTALNRTERLGHTNGELMFLFRILQDEKIILDNIPKEQIALAISILTGISTNTVYNDYAFKKPYNYSKMAGSPIQNSQLVNKTKNRICDAVIGVFTKTGKRTF